jgi:hypothetical protein
MGGHGGSPVQEGARGIVWAATLSDDGPSGGFFCDGKAVPWYQRQWIKLCYHLTPPIMYSR